LLPDTEFLKMQQTFRRDEFAAELMPWKFFAFRKRDLKPSFGQPDGEA
jgi:hypothetical protein